MMKIAPLQGEKVRVAEREKINSFSLILHSLPLAKTGGLRLSLDHTLFVTGKA